MRTRMFLGVALVAAACGGNPSQSAVPATGATTPSPPALSARAQINDAQGQSVATATIRETAQGAAIEVTVTKLSPGAHGIHIHAAAKCDGPSFATAGGHFNPTGKQHGHNNPQGSHAGDLGNLIVAADGTVKAMFTADKVTLKEALPNSLFGPDGTSLVIHAKEDDEVSDPAGNSGPRIACGVITR